MPDLGIGDKAPDFTLERDGGGSVSLKDFKGRKLVLYFYPKDDTPGCTKEAIAFTALKSAFAKHGAEVVGVSADAVRDIEKFKNKHELKVTLASDESKAMLTAYGAWGEKSMYGRLFMGVRQDVPHRRRADRPHLAQGEGRRARRRGARGRPRLVIPSTKLSVQRIGLRLS